MAEIIYNTHGDEGINRAIVNSEGELLTTVGGFLSTENVTETPLASGSSYIGTAELNKASDVMVTTKSDTNGMLYFDFSVDGINWDSTLSTQYDTTRINPPHIFTKGERYFRVRFVNEGGAQTVFRLNTYYGTFSKLTATLNSTLAESFDAQVTRPTNFHYEVAMGKRQGHSTWNKWGYNADIDTGASELIWSHSNGWTRMTGSSTLDLVSTSNEDSGSGTGASSCLIYGMDGDYNENFEIITLNGTTPVTTTNEYLGVNRLAIYNSSTNEINVGTIDAYVSGVPTDVQAEIPIGEGSTQQALFFVPENHTALVDWMFINVNKTSGGSSPKITIRMWTYSYVTNSKYEVFRDIIDVSVENHLELKPSQPFIVTGKQIMWIEAETDTNNSTVGARFSLILERVQ